MLKTKPRKSYQIFLKNKTENVRMLENDTEVFLKKTNLMKKKKTKNISMHVI